MKIFLIFAENFSFCDFRILAIFELLNFAGRQDGRTTWEGKRRRGGWKAAAQTEGRRRDDYEQQRDPDGSGESGQGPDGA